MYRFNYCKFNKSIKTVLRGFAHKKTEAVASVIMNSICFLIIQHQRHYQHQ